MVEVLPSTEVAEASVVVPADGSNDQSQAEPDWWDRQLRLRRFLHGGALDDDFDHIESLLEKRNHTLRESLKDLTVEFGHAGPQIRPEALFRLAAVDLFVEKAQSVLSARARRMSRAGFAASITAVLCLALLAGYIVIHANAQPRDGKDLLLNELILRIVTAVSLGAVVLVAVKYLISLARSFFHESVTLLSRRHALRFGRMYVYLHDGDIDLKELRKVFDWNRGGDSSFLDIKADEIGKTPWSVLAKGIGDAVEKGFEKGADKLASKMQSNANTDSNRDSKTVEN
ncbi:hypothetical protein [Mycolicibacterium helvum]|nr:hypothetical protein [Mycolicibacterium helvum]